MYFASLFLLGSIMKFGKLNAMTLAQERICAKSFILNKERQRVRAKYRLQGKKVSHLRCKQNATINFWSTKLIAKINFWQIGTNSE